MKICWHNSSVISHHYHYLCLCTALLVSQASADDMEGEFICVVCDYLA